MIKFSYVICHRASDYSRARNLDAVIKYLRKNYKDQIEIIIVEQSRLKSKIDNVNIHIHIEDDGLFNRSLTLNKGVEASNNEIVFVADNDVIIPTTGLNEAISLFGEYQVVRPNSRMLDLSEEETNHFIRNIEFNTYNNTCERQSMNIASACLGFIRSTYLKIGGFDERFIGWGGEDDMMAIKVNTLTKNIILENTAIHLNHNRGVNNGTHIHEHYQENVRILEEIRRLNSEELLRYFSEMGWI